MKPDRLRQLMDVQGLSQSELGRRVGVSQATIYKLLVGETYGSKHLHRIARELGTTPAYLTGETDDPNRDTGEVELGYDDRLLLDRVRSVGREERAVFDQLARVLSRHSQERPALHLPGERPLTAMFEALLAGINPSLPQDDKARLLAQRLPIALAQLQDLQPEPDIEAAEASDVAQPIPHPEQTR